MKFFSIRFFSILAFLLVGHTFFAQDVKVSAVLDSSKIRIGEQVKLDLYVSYPANQKNLKIQWPTIGDTLTGKVEVVSVSAIDTTMPDKTNSPKIFQHQQITISAYDSGYFSIPGFKFIVNNDTTNALYTDNFLLEVHTVPTDTSDKKLKDIKPPFGEKFNWRWFKAYIYGGIAFVVFIALVVFITLYIARRRKQVILEPDKPKIPAHITALAALETIKQQQVWKEEKVKEYYSSISDAIRLYIEERFNVNALESTTDEIMLAFRSQVVDKDSKEKLQQLLMLSDLVKFAKQFPIEQEHLFTLQNAFDFVNGTKREELLAPDNNTSTATTIIESTIVENNHQQASSQNNSTTEINSSTQVSKDPLYNSGAQVNSVGSKKPLNKTLIKIIVGALSLILFGLLVYNFVFSGSSHDNRIVEIAEGMNKDCPFMVSNDTRIDNVVAIPGGILQYNYTLVNVMAGQVDITVLKGNIEPFVLSQIKTNLALKEIRDNQVTTEHYFKDRNGVFLFSVQIGPKDYNQNI